MVFRRSKKVLRKITRKAKLSRISARETLQVILGLGQTRIAQVSTLRSTGLLNSSLGNLATRLFHQKITGKNCCQICFFSTENLVTTLIQVPLMSQHKIPFLWLSAAAMISSQGRSQYLPKKTPSLTMIFSHLISTQGLKTDTLNPNHRGRTSSLSMSSCQKIKATHSKQASMQQVHITLRGGHPQNHAKEIPFSSFILFPNKDT